jgi:NADH:ubiquinone oxidoreductase subunit K
MSNVNMLFITGFLLLGIACYGLLITRHMLKLIAVLQIMGKSILILFLAAGQANGNLALAQSLMLSLIAAETMLAVLALALTVQIFERTGTMDIRALSSLKG